MKMRRFGRACLRVSQVVLGAGYVGGIIVLADDGIEKLEPVYARGFAQITTEED